MLIKIMFGLLLLFLVMTVFSVKVYPAMRWGLISPCWGKFISDMGSFSDVDFIRKPQEITVGECVSAIMFVNKRVPEDYFKSFDEYKEELNCNEEGQSYIIGFPHSKYDDVGWNVFKWPDKIWEEMKEFWREDIGGVTPVCRMLDREKPFVFTGDKKGEALVYDKDAGAKTYCIDIELTDDKKAYRVKIDEGMCNNEDKKEDVGIPITL
jgi:hypothetical protein